MLNQTDDAAQTLAHDGQPGLHARAVADLPPSCTAAGAMIAAAGADR